MLNNFQAAGSTGGEFAKDTDITPRRRNSNREEVELLRLPSLLDGIVVVEVVESDGVCRMPVC